MTMRDGGKDTLQRRQDSLLQSLVRGNPRHRQRYGKRLAGFWFDYGAFTYYPYNAPWEKMSAAAKAGNAERLITYNSWILPKLNDFYEASGGENEFSQRMIDGDGYLPAGDRQVHRRSSGGTARSNHNDREWRSGTLQTQYPIGPPRYSTGVMIAKIKDVIERRNVPLLDIEVYQDGTISPETLQMFLAIRREIKPASIQRDKPNPTPSLNRGRQNKVRFSTSHMETIS